MRALASFTAGGDLSEEICNLGDGVEVDYYNFMKTTPQFLRGYSNFLSTADACSRAVVGIRRSFILP